MDRALDFIVTEYARTLIQVKARQLGRRRDCRTTDPADIQQDLWLALCEAAEGFDSSVASLNTYTSCIVDTAVAMNLRSRHRLKNGSDVPHISLSQPLAANQESPEALMSLVSEEDLSRRTGARRVDEAADREVAEAWEHALAIMPVEIRDVLRSVLGGTVASAARENGVSRRQILKALTTAMPFLEESGFNFPV